MHPPHHLPIPRPPPPTSSLGGKRRDLQAIGGVGVRGALQALASVSPPGSEAPQRPQHPPSRTPPLGGCLAGPGLESSAGGGGAAAESPRGAGGGARVRDPDVRPRASL